MNVPPTDTSLRSLICRARGPSGGRLCVPGGSFALDRLAVGSVLDCPRDELADSSVLVATGTQLAAALTLVELDGIARRLVLWPPGLATEHLDAVIRAAEVDTLVADEGTDCNVPDGVRLVRCGTQVSGAQPIAPLGRRTEWILLTSGTTGMPKLVVHSLASLTAPIGAGDGALAPAASWSTFYDIRRYGGLQIFLRAALGGALLVLSDAREATADFLARAGNEGVTHISGTPSHWRRVLMSPAAGYISPRYVRLSGEIADQAILNDLRGFYRNARIEHAFASTEAGVAFKVDDGLAGFPEGILGCRDGDVEMKLEDGSLHIRSCRTACDYLGNARGTLRTPDGFVDTGDIVERRGNRYHFLGRRGGIVNVGGLKVHPEEVEMVINRHPSVRMSLVKARRSPFTGSVVVADVVVRPDRKLEAADQLQAEIIDACRRTLPPHKVPVSIRFVSSLDVGRSGKLARRRSRMS